LRAKKDGFYALEYLKKGYKEYIKLNLFDDAMVCTHGIGDIYHYGRGGVTVNKQEAIKWHELTLELYPKSDAKKDGFPFLKNSSEASLKKLRGL
jgi:TPR repeat protein